LSSLEAIEEGQPAADYLTNVDEYLATLSSSHLKIAQGAMDPLVELTLQRAKGLRAEQPSAPN
jgi:hypothetical protein